MKKIKEESIKSMIINLSSYAKISLETLTKQTGIIVKEIYPFYVKRQIVEGLTYTIIPAIGFLVFLVVFLYLGFRMDYSQDADFMKIMIVLFGITTVIFFIVTIINLVLYLPKIFNPHMEAITRLRWDILNTIATLKNKEN